MRLDGGQWLLGVSLDQIFATGIEFVVTTTRTGTDSVAHVALVPVPVLAGGFDLIVSHAKVLGDQLEAGVLLAVFDVGGVGRETHGEIEQGLGREGRGVHLGFAGSFTLGFHVQLVSHLHSHKAQLVGQSVTGGQVAGATERPDDDLAFAAPAGAGFELFELGMLTVDDAQLPVLGGLTFFTDDPFLHGGVPVYVVVTYL